MVVKSTVPKADAENLKKLLEAGKCSARKWHAGRQAGTQPRGVHDRHAVALGCCSLGVAGGA